MATYCVTAAKINDTARNWEVALASAERAIMSVNKEISDLEANPPFLQATYNAKKAKLSLRKSEIESQKTVADRELSDARGDLVSHRKACRECS